MAETKRQRRLWTRGLLALGSLMFFLLALEVLVRVKNFSPLIKPHPCNPGWNHGQYLVMPDPDAGYALRPFFEGEESNHYGDFRVKTLINAWGLRDNKFFPALCEDCYRVLTLGDSFTYGEGLAWEETYPARLEEWLRKAGRGPVQVFNGGVPAYSLRHMAVRLRKYLPILKPNLVTVCWIPWTFSREKSDMVYMNGYLVMGEEKDRTRVVNNNLFLSHYPEGSFRERGDLWLQAHSLAYFLIKFNRAWTSIPFQLIFKAGEKRGQPYNIPPVYFAEPMKSILQMAEDCRQNHVRFLLILLEPSDDNAKMVSDFCRSRNIPVLALAEKAYMPSSPYHKFIFPHDGHFNAQGDAYIAEKLAPLILQMGTSPPLPNPNGQSLP